MLTVYKLHYEITLWLLWLLQRAHLKQTWPAPCWLPDVTQVKLCQLIQPHYDIRLDFMSTLAPQDVDQAEHRAAIRPHLNITQEMTNKVKRPTLAKCVCAT